MLKLILLNNFFGNVFQHRTARAYVGVLDFLDRKSIKTHLILTEIAMRTASTRHLDEAQKNNRAHVIDLLHAYWKREEFPKNIDNPGKRLPHIRDNRGVLCAMGYILYKTGASEYVDELNKTDNNVYINDISDGPLYSWLEVNGVTKKEAMRIQPTYKWQMPWPDYGAPGVSLLDHVLQFLPFVLAVVIIMVGLFVAHWLVIVPDRLSHGKKLIAYTFLTLHVLAMAIAIAYVLHHFLFETYFFTPQRMPCDVVPCGPNIPTVGTTIPAPTEVF